MRITVPRSFKPTPPTETVLSQEEILAMVADLPAEVVFSSDDAELVFNSPRAAADFVGNLHGRVPYTISGVEEDEESAFLELLASTGDVLENGEFTPALADRVSRRWAIAAFSVGTSAAAVALAALVLAIVAVAS